MKKFFLSGCIIFVLMNISFAQKSSFGLSVGIGGGSVLKQALAGGASYDLKTGYLIGIDYSGKLNNKLSFQSGLNYYSNTVVVTPNINPDIDQTPKELSLNLIYIPLSLKFDRSKYFFVNAGFIADIDISKNKTISNQSGLGVMLGVGSEISISNNFAIQISPYANLHGLLLLKGDNYPERVLDAGIKLSFILK